jgi:hypothetical protein
MPEPKRKRKNTRPKESQALILVPRRTSTGPKCKVCAHPSLTKINKMIADGESTRRIASHFMAFSDGSVRRHISKCLNLEIRALIQENRIIQAVNHYEEIRAQLQFSKELQAAAREILTCDETGRISFAPRALDIDVIYHDLTDIDPKTRRPRTKMRNLQSVIDKLSEIPEIKNVQSIVQWADLKDYALRTISAVDAILDKFARIEGRYKDKADNTEADELKRLRSIVQKRAEDEGIPYNEMLMQIFVPNFAHLYKAELVEKLVSEANN